MDHNKEPGEDVVPAVPTDTKPPESIYCPKCGYDWIEHDPSKPEPNCPRYKEAP